MTNYGMLITKWDEKSSESRDQKFFAGRKHVTENKLRVAGDIVHHKIVFFERIW